MRPFLLLALAGGMIVTFTACGDDNSPPQPLRISVAGPPSLVAKISAGPTYLCGPFTLTATAGGGKTADVATWLGASFELWNITGAAKITPAREVWTQELTATLLEYTHHDHRRREILDRL